MGVTAAIAFGASLLQGGASVVGSVTEAGAQREQAKYQQHQYDVNAKLAEDQGADAIKQGDLDASQHGEKVAALRGSQRAAYAAQGIDVNSGVAAETQADTVALGAADVAKIKEDAFRKAWGYKVEAQNATSKGQMAKIAGDNAAGTTLLTGGIKALGYGAQALTYAGAFGGKK